ncbi:flagellar hook assembly protein FlgD [Oceanicoccus sp. KOV_DT_Chl]|uniref:flagellar hook assembly protein FlgD n=1 Tax=Oceanicoccus sp. KOV_DT_Chl TaxID=1904639 RepID=UPI000C7A05E8|nr:flagellar hook assembly protein FlgD [Oceanicoccus sp. KOV_DT_Chl]
MTDAISTGLLSDISVQEKYAAEPKSKELGQDVFLELMVTQMRNQNPLDPQDNSEFVAQLAQFSSVEGLDKLNNTMGDFVGSFESSLQSNQALQASAMVGRFVIVNSDTSYLGNEGLIAGTIDVPQTTDDLKVNVYNEEGELVAEELLGAAEAGPMSFAWDGNIEGTQLPAGNYRFEAYANFGGDDVQLNTALSHNVDSVTVGANGAVSLNVAGVGPVSISSVREIL